MTSAMTKVDSEVHALSIVSAFIACWNKCVFVHVFARTVVYVYKCLSVGVHAPTIVCAYIDGWHICVFVHAFAGRVVSV